MMELKELKRLISLFEKADITELEVESKDVRVRLKKEIQGKTLSSVEYSSPPAPVKPTEEKEVHETGEEKLHQILSPMVGTFYRAPSPDSPPYVEVGQEVKVDETVCIIEAMKIMNEIKAEVNGRIVKVLVENGEPVEFEQPLFLVEPLPK